MAAQRTITVFCSSSRHVTPEFVEAGKSLGKAIAEAGWSLVYGGNALGTMKALADAVRAGGGRVVGVTPKALSDPLTDDTACDEFIVTRCLRTRKEAMEQRGDAFVALPGGLGTLDELCDILVSKVVGCHDKPIVVVNVAGFYDPLVALIDHAIDRRFVKAKTRELYHVAAGVDDAIAFLRSAFSAAEARRSEEKGPQMNADQHR